MGGKCIAVSERASRTAALAECRDIALAAVREFGPLTAQGARTVAGRIEQLLKESESNGERTQKV